MKNKKIIKKTYVEEHKQTDRQRNTLYLLHPRCNFTNKQTKKQITHGKRKNKQKEEQ